MNICMYTVICIIVSILHNLSYIYMNIHVYVYWAMIKNMVSDVRWSYFVPKYGIIIRINQVDNVHVWWWTCGSPRIVGAKFIAFLKKITFPWILAHLQTVFSDVVYFSGDKENIRGKSSGPHVILSQHDTILRWSALPVQNINT